MELKKSTIIQIFLQIFRTTKEACNFISAGHFARGVAWFLVRNKTSLIGNGAKGIRKNGGGGLFESGFKELSPLNQSLVDELVKYFLGRNNNRGITLSEYFNANRESGFIRSSPIGIELDADLMSKLLRATNLCELVCAYLRLPKRDIFFSAKIDSLTRISGKRNFLNGYDDALKFHRDVDSMKFVKAFIYLNDISEGSGHHEVFLGSHRKIPWSLRVIRRVDEYEIEKKMPACRKMKITGTRGYSWIEDTTTFHRGTVPHSGDRLMLSLSFNDKKTAELLYDDYYPLTMY